MPTAPDFRALQVRLEKLIVSGTNGPHRVLVYPWTADGSPSGEGNINSAVFSTSSVGSDTFFYVSGAVGGKDVSGGYTISTFGGDVTVSGSQYVLTNFKTFGAGEFVGNVSITSSLQVIGYGLFGTGITGSHFALNSGGEPAFVAGPFITITSQSNGAVAFTGSMPTFTAGPHVTIVTNSLGDEVTISGSMPVFSAGPNVTIVTNSLGNQVAISSSMPVFTAGPHVTIVTNSLGNEVTISGSMPVFSAGPFITIVTNSLGNQVAISGSAPTFLAGPGIAITTQSNGAIVQISGTLTTSSSGSAISLGLTDYAGTSNTTSTVVGQYPLNALLYSHAPMFLRGILAASSASISASVRLWNATSGAYVHISGSNALYLSTVGPTPTYLESVNLVGAMNFNTSSRHIYELHLSTSNASYPVYAGGWHFAVSASSFQGPQGQAGTNGTDPNASYVVIGLTSSLSNERALTAGPGITITDNGANSTVVISASKDTGLPRMTWFDYNKVFIVPDKSDNITGSYTDKPIRLTLQDGIQRSYTGSLLYITSSVAGQLGLDTGGVISGSSEKWFYLYMVPSGSNSNTTTLSVIASAQSPTGTVSWGPSGYTNFRYVGAILYKTSSVGSGFSFGSDTTPAAGIQPFFQTDAKTFTYFGSYPLYTETNSLNTASLNVTAPTGSGTTGLPTTVSKIHANFLMLISSSAGGDQDTYLRHRIYSQLVYFLGWKPYHDIYTAAGAVSRFQGSITMPVGYPTEGHSYDIVYRTSIVGTTPTSYTNFFGFYWTGYEDAYLDASVR